MDGENQNKTRKRNSFLSLEDNLVNEVFTFLGSFQDVLNVLLTSKEAIRSFSNALLWRDMTVDLCTTTGCFGCGRMRVNINQALLLCNTLQLNSLRLHVPINFLNSILARLTVENTVKNIHVRIANYQKSLLDSETSIKKHSRSGSAKSTNNKRKLSFSSDIDEVQQPSHNNILLLESLTVYGWPSRETISRLQQQQHHQQQQRTVAESSNKRIKLQKQNQYPSNHHHHLCWQQAQIYYSFDNILRQVGGQLLTLKFMENAPRDIFKLLVKYCPRLQTLVIDSSHVLQVESLLDYHSETLTTLAIYDTKLKFHHCKKCNNGTTITSIECQEHNNYTTSNTSNNSADNNNNKTTNNNNNNNNNTVNYLTRKLSLPNLQRFEYIHHQQMHYIPSTSKAIYRIISLLPTFIQVIDIKISAHYCNELLVAVANNQLMNLQTLILRLTDENLGVYSTSASHSLGSNYYHRHHHQHHHQQQQQQHGIASILPRDIQYESLVLFYHCCQYSLQCFEILSYIVSFEESAFLFLANFRQLKRLKMVYDDDLVGSMNTQEVHDLVHVNSLPMSISQQNSSLLLQLLNSSHQLQEIILYENAIERMSLDDNNNNNTTNNNVNNNNNNNIVNTLFNFYHPENHVNNHQHTPLFDDWTQMEEKLQVISEQCPAVKITLCDGNDFMEE